MNSKRPSISLRRPKKPSVKKPKGKPRASPKGGRPTSQLGLCLICDEAVWGPAAIRLRHGAIKRKRRGVSFVQLPFDDRDTNKWVCHGCALDHFMVTDEGFRPSSHLQRLSANGQCCLCSKVIEPYPLEIWSSAILISFGFSEPVRSKRGSFSMFKPKHQGHVHFNCMDELHIELWRLIERTDTPDYDEHLKCG